MDGPPAIIARTLQDRDDAFDPEEPIDPGFVQDAAAVISALTRAGYRIEPRESDPTAEALRTALVAIRDRINHVLRS
jgi:hypothetical protein